MNSFATRSLVVGLLAASYSLAQYTPPPPPVTSPGEINELLRANDPSFKEWDIGISIRGREENRDNAGTTKAGSNWDFSRRAVDDNNNDYQILRVMPHITYTNPWFTASVETRTSYSWGDERYVSTAPGQGLADRDGPIDIYQAFIQVGNLKEYPVTLKIGRQELNYGEQRILGSAKWLNNPRTFDAIKLHWQNDVVSADLFTAGVVYVQNDHLNRSNSQDLLSGAYLNFPTVSKSEIVEAYFLARNVARGIVTDNWSQVAAPNRFPAPQDIYTAGFRIKSKPKAYGPWDYGLEAMYQFGNRTAVFPATTVATALAAPRLEQSAYAFIAQAGYTFADAWGKPRLAFIYSDASGDKNPNDNKSQTFQNLFPSNHGLYGIMDLTGLQNMHDARLAYSIKPRPDLSVTAEGHLQYLDRSTDFWYNAAGAPRNFTGAPAASGNGYRINPTYSDKLGEEVDLIVGWYATKYSLLEFGAAHYFRGDYIKQSLAKAGSVDGSYLFAQVTLNL